jgi:TRAP-type C4-dicarboxylate transport system permease small subunit
MEMPGASEQNPDAPGHIETANSFGHRLESWATTLAIIGGLILTALSVFTVFSVIGRAAFDSPILGDSEVTEMACGLAVFMFLPYCQIKGGNIVVDFFTTGLSEQRRAFLDVFHNVIFTFVVVILTWRMMAGGIDAWKHGEISMMLGLPIWIGITGSVLAMILLVLVCLHTVYINFEMSKS